MNVRDSDFGIDEAGGSEPPRADLLAGEYVLGVLDAETRVAVETRMTRDPAFARLVDDWTMRLAPWLDEFDTGPVPAHVWPRIRAALGWSAVEPARHGLWHRTGFWRGAAALAAAVAIIAVLFGRTQVDRAPGDAQPVATSPTGTAPDVPLPVTTLAHADGSPGWLASVDLAHGRVLLVPVPSPADGQGRVPELWLIPEGAAPVSLGLVSGERAHSVGVPSGLRAALVTGTALAVSLEPPGGAPGGAPTGPVVASGALRL
ncbi:MAG: anti-sigma factor [Luteimonas sp.]